MRSENLRELLSSDGKERIQLMRQLIPRLNDWKCRLTSRSALSLQYLRAKMSKALLYGNSNAVMYKILHLIQECNEEGKKKGPIDVEKMIATYTK